MTDFKRIPDSWDSIDDQAWQAAPAEIGVQLPAPKRTWLRGQCGQLFACACGTGGGLLAGHAGCIASYALTFSTAGLSAGLSASGTAIGLSTTATVAGTALWYGLRGKAASSWEKAVTAVGIAAGTVISLSIHFGSDHGHMAAADKAAAYYQSLSPENQERIRSIPQGETLFQFLASICGADRPQPSKSRSETTKPKP